MNLGFWERLLRIYKSEFPSLTIQIDNRFKNHAFSNLLLNDVQFIYPIQSHRIEMAIKIIWDSRILDFEQITAYIFFQVLFCHFSGLWRYYTNSNRLKLSKYIYSTHNRTTNKHFRFWIFECDLLVDGNLMIVFLHTPNLILNTKSLF